MRSVNISFATEQEKIEFVNKCEQDFERRLCEISKSVVDSGAEALLLSGPTCAGKQQLLTRLFKTLRTRAEGLVWFLLITSLDREQSNAQLLETMIWIMIR